MKRQNYFKVHKNKIKRKRVLELWKYVPPKITLVFKKGSEFHQYYIFNTTFKSLL